MYEISSGKVNKAKKVVIYGTEGVGKTLLASKFPDPVFIDTEGSTGEYDVKRMPNPTSWSMLLDEIRQFRGGRTLVIDTADWAEKLATASVCESHKWNGIEEPGYGAGYRYVYDEMGRMLNELSNVVEKGINVVVTAHAVVRKVELPNEMGAYDRWELKLQNAPKCNVAAMLKEWADLLLFANFQTFVVKNEKTKTNKAQGQKRMIYATHNACYDAKNRNGLPSEMELDYANIAHLFEDSTYREAPKTELKAAEEPPKENDKPQAEIPQPSSAETKLTGNDAAPRNKEDEMLDPAKKTSDNEFRKIDDCK